MSVLQFSDVRAYKLFDNDEEFNLGSFKTPDSIELRHTRLGIYIEGMTFRTGTEQITQKIYTDENVSRLIYTSSPSSLSDISWDATKQGFLGYLRIDWDRVNLNKNFDYYFTAEISGYVRTASFYVSLNWDFPDSVYDNGGANWENHPVAMQIFGFKEL